MHLVLAVAFANLLIVAGLLLVPSHPIALHILVPHEESPTLTVCDPVLSSVGGDMWEGIQGQRAQPDVAEVLRETVDGGPRTGRLAPPLFAGPRDLVLAISEGYHCTDRVNTRPGSTTHGGDFLALVVQHACSVPLSYSDERKCRRGLPLKLRWQDMASWSI